MQSTLAAVLMLAAPTSGESSASGDTISVADALDLDAEGSCLEHDRLAERIVFWLKRDRIDGRLAITVRNDPEVHGVRYVLESGGEFVSERPFEWTTKDCADRHYVFALSIAMALDATVLEAVLPVTTADPDPPEDPPPEDPPPEDPPPEDPPPEDPPPEDPPPEDPPPKPSPRTAVRLGARGLFTIGTPTGVGGGGELALELGWLDLVDVDGRLLVSTTGEQSFAGGRFTSTAVAGRLNLCAGPQLGRVRPRACAGALSGVALARGREFERSGRARLPWVALVLGANVRVDLTSRLALDFALEGVGTAVRPVFVVESDAGPSLREFARFGVALGIGLSMQLR